MNDVKLILRPLPDDVPVAIRLRAALKRLLRSYHLQCVHVEDVPAVAPDRPAAASGEGKATGDTSST
jgi:hypothetical protein